MGLPRAGWGCVKDTSFLSVGHSSSSAPDDVAVEGDLEGVAVGGVVQEPSEEATARACLHSIPVEGCAGLRETRKEGRIRQDSRRQAIRFRANLTIPLGLSVHI